MTERCQRCGGRGWVRQIAFTIDWYGEPACWCDLIDCPDCQGRDR
jgi:hypothetical protein